MVTILKNIKSVLSNIRREHISAFAAYSAFFLVLSLLPMLMLVLSIIKAVDVDTSVLQGMLKSYTTAQQNQLMNYLLDDISISPPAIISFSTLFTAWSAGKAFHALGQGFGAVLKTESQKSYFFLRLRSLIYSLLFAILFVFIIILGLFGNHVSILIANIFPRYYSWYTFASSMRMVFTLFVLFGVIALIYRFVPDWGIAFENSPREKPKIKSICFSAMLSAIAIQGYTYLFSIYVTIVSQNSNAFGGMSTLAAILLWIYGTLYIILLGFRLTAYFNAH
ncbi:MAG: YihY/virulence factor BrkB family protein [Clostridia bacterium]|nr:YihY/virulence factor BrkB family protein [Clostridia bacterium]